MIPKTIFILYLLIDPYGWSIAIFDQNPFNTIQECIVAKASVDRQVTHVANDSFTASQCVAQEVVQ